MPVALVTGGAGFVGSHLVDRLCSGGHDVIVLDNLSTGRLSNLASALSTNRVTFVFGNVATAFTELRDTLLSALGDRKLFSIFHLASPASPEAYGAAPWETLSVNGVGTMSLIDLAIEFKAKMLFCSTSEVYGDPIQHPQPESYFGNVNCVGPRACYDEGKRFGEAAISVASYSRGLDARIVRLFNCYGPRMDIQDGRLIPSLLAAIQARVPLPIHGTGQQTRSMTFVDDVIRGLMTVMDDPTLSGQIPVNLGSEEELSISAIAAAVSDVAGSKLETIHLDARPEDPQRRRPDISLARRLGWEPAVDLLTGLRNTLDWYRNESIALV